jgi:hypothetical protein
MAQPPGFFMRFSFFHVLSLAMVLSVGPSLGSSPSASPRSLLVREDFDVRSMTASSASITSHSQSGASAGSYGTAGSSNFSLSLDQPARFSMAQSYSLTAMSGAHGSASSGLYLNTLSYHLTPLVSAFVDVGFHTPIHSSLPGFEQNGGAGSLVLPRMGLEYRPSDRLTFNFELVNGPDAWKAWGGSPAGMSSSRSFSGSRIP